MSVAKCPACLFLFAARHTTIYMICLLNHASLKFADIKQHDALVIGAYLHVCHRVLRIESNFRRLRGLPGFMLLIQHRKNVRSYGTTFIKFRYFTSASFSSLSQSAFVIFFQGFFSFVLFSSFAFFSSVSNTNPQVQWPGNMNVTGNIQPCYSGDLEQNCLHG